MRRDPHNVEYPIWTFVIKPKLFYFSFILQVENLNAVLYPVQTK
jgi:hypothetical protein